MQACVTYSYLTKKKLTASMLDNVNQFLIDMRNSAFDCYISADCDTHI